MDVLRWLLYYATLGTARHPNAPEGSEPLLTVHAFLVDYALPFEAMYVRQGRAFYEVAEWDYGSGIFFAYDVDGHRHELSKTDAVWCVMRPKALSGS